MSKDITQTPVAVADDVRYALQLLKERYGADDFTDSRKSTGTRRPVRTVKWSTSPVEIGVPLNADDLSLYTRNRTLDGQKLTELLPQVTVKKKYSGGEEPARSIKNSAFLGTASGEETVLLAPARSELIALFDAFFARPKTAPVPTSTEPTAPAASGSKGAKKAPVDAETFEALLERRSEVGQAGEMLAVQDELERLAELGCPEPQRWVERVALVDVGRGYDIASTWPGHERYIEVKSTTSTSGGLFITSNERRVLADLGERAWLYRVVVKADGTRKVVIRLQDPMSALPPEAFEPVVFQVAAAALSACSDGKDGASA